MFKPGDEWNGNPHGRPKGSKNHQTEKIRKAYQDLVDRNLENIETWLAAVALEDPGRAIDLLLKISPYILPKLTQSDITSNGLPINIVLPKPQDSEESETDE